MDTTEHTTYVLSWAWLLATVGGPLLLCIVYAVVLIGRHTRRRSGAAAALAPSRQALSEGRALSAGDIVNCVAGAWIFLSPWVAGHFGSALAASNALFGAMIFIFALAAVYRLNTSEELVNLALGIWVFVSPWVIGAPDASAAAHWSNAASGGVVILASLYSLLHLRGHPHAASRF